MLARIVAATDFSAGGGNAVRRAAMLASLHRVELELLHVVSGAALDSVRAWVRTPPDVAERLVEDARSLLGQAAAALGTPATARVAVGDVLEEIVGGCAPGSLLAVGARGLSPLRDALLGTTAERLAGRSRCPVLVVRRPAERPYASVLAALDLLPGSEKVLAAASGIAPGARMAAAHAFDVPFEGALQRAGVSAAEIDQHRAAAFARALGEISALGAKASGGPDRFLPMVERGDAARLIVDSARAVDADLLILGKRSRPAFGEWLLGSVTRHVLADVDCDVLLLGL